MSDFDCLGGKGSKVADFVPLCAKAKAKPKPAKSLVPTNPVLAKVVSSKPRNQGSTREGPELEKKRPLWQPLAVDFRRGAGAERCDSDTLLESLIFHMSKHVTTPGPGHLDTLCMFSRSSLELSFFPRDGRELVVVPIAVE